MTRRFNGAILSLEWKEAIWDRHVTGAPRPRTRSEQQYSDRKCSLTALSREFGINPKNGGEMAEAGDGRGPEDLAEGPSFHDPDRSRRGGGHRIPAAHIAAAGRLPLCATAVDPSMGTCSLIVAIAEIPAIHVRLKEHENLNIVGGVKIAAALGGVNFPVPADR